MTLLIEEVVLVMRFARQGKWVEMDLIDYQLS